MWKNTSMAPFLTTIFKETDLDLQGSVLMIFHGFEEEKQFLKIYNNFVDNTF